MRLQAECPLTVLHTESSLNLGGQELCTLTQMRWLLDHQMDTVLLARPESAIYAQAAHQDLPLIDADFRASLNPALTLKIWRLARTRPNAVIDCHSSRDASVVVPLRFLGVPVVRTQHICKRLKADMLHALVWKWGAHHVIACSQSIANRLETQRLVPRERISVVGEAADQRLFHPGVDGEPIRREWHIDPATKVITVIGMIRPDKGQANLVRAVDLVCAQVPNCVFLIVGSPTRPEYGTALSEEMSRVSHRDKIILTGFQDDVPGFIAASDVIVLTSYAEAQSRIIPEAFSMKRLVVAPEVGGIPELARHGQTALLYKMGDVPRLAETIVQALQGGSMALCRRAYELACGHLGLDRHMQATLSVYRGVRAHRT